MVLSDVARAEEICNSFDNPMSSSEYNKYKRQICSLLRCKEDPPPVCNVLPGKLKSYDAMKLISQELKENPSAKLERGYKLIAFAGSNFYGFSFHGKPLVLLRYGNGKLCCFTRCADMYTNSPFIFVPSSRMHKELSDEQLLSGRYALCKVVGGCRIATSTTLLIEPVEFCASPEEGEARPLIVLLRFPLFSEFWESEKGKRHARSDIESVGIAFGMSHRLVAENESIESLFSCVAEDGLISWHSDTSGKWVRKPADWLPSTGELIRALDMMYIDESVPEHIHPTLLFHLYGKLSDEYILRKKKHIDNLTLEINAKAERFS